MTLAIGAHLSDGRRIMVSDGRTSVYSSNILTDTSVKIRQPQPGITFTLAGSSFYKAVFHNALKDLKRRTPDDVFYALGPAFAKTGEKFQGVGLIWLDEELYFIDGDLWPLKIPSFYAIGSGGDFATGYLTGCCGKYGKPTENQVRQAYMAALEADSGCGGTLQFVGHHPLAARRAKGKTSKSVGSHGKGQQTAKVRAKAQSRRKARKGKN